MAKTEIKTEVEKLEKNEYFEAIASGIFGIPFSQLIEEIKENKSGAYDHFYAK